MEPKYTIPHNLRSLDDVLNMKLTKKINRNDLESFVNFLKGLLTIDPKQRWNAKICLNHPFITKEKFEGKYSTSNRFRFL